MSSKLTLNFTESSSISDVGGKGFNLQKLTQGGFQVPKGFVVTTRSFSEFIKETKIGSFLKSQITKVFDLLKVNKDDLKGVKDVCITMEDKIKSGTLPKSIMEAIEKSYKSLDLKSVSVRSSGVNEDLGEFSFAGLYETFLNVLSIKDICEKLKSCWASMFNERCLLYQIRNGFLKREAFKTNKDQIEDEEDISGIPGMAVVVQEMINSKFSGVMFSVDVQSQNNDLILINSSYGIGEGVVSGIAAVDEYIVSKSKKTIVEKIINKKTKAIVQNEKKEGVTVVDIDESKQLEMCMSEKLVLSIADIGKRIETMYDNIPQDIEFAIGEKQEIYILQSRAITSLFPPLEPVGNNVFKLEKGKDTFIPKDFEKKMKEFMNEYNKSDRIYSNIGPSQMFMDPFTPMGLSMLICGLKPIMSYVESKYETHRYFIGGGRFFFSSGDFMWKLRQKAGDQSAEMMDFILKERKMYKKQFKPTAKILGLVPFALNFYLKIIKSCCQVPTMTPEKYENDSEAILKTLIEELGKYKKYPEDMEREALEKTKNMIRVFELKYIFEILKTFTTPVIGIISQTIANKLSGKPDLHLYISGGLEGNVTTGMLSQLTKLAKIAKGNDDLLSLLSELEKKKLPVKEVFKIFEENKDKVFKSDEFVKEFKLFFEKHGFRAPGEIDIYAKRYYEDTSFVLSSIITSSKSDIESIEKRKEDARKKSIIDIKRVIKETRKKSICSIWNLLTCGWFGCINPCCVKSLINTTRKTIVFREHIKYYLIKMNKRVKEQMKEIAEVLKEIEYINEIDDFFFLYLPEVVSLLENVVEKNKGSKEIKKSYIKGLIKYRRKRYEMNKKIEAPQFMNNLGENVDNSFFRKKREELKKASRRVGNEFYGQGVSPGKVSGIARVIGDAKDCYKLKKGEILVTNHTDPGYTPVFINVAGLVLEVGGSLTHGALIAREIGLPCVTGVEKAMKRINTGDEIEIDGWTGHVKILKKCEITKVEEIGEEEKESSKTEEVIIIEDVSSEKKEVVVEEKKEESVVEKKEIVVEEKKDEVMKDSESMEEKNVELEDI